MFIHCCFHHIALLLNHWLERLQEYNFSVAHRTGIQHGNADSLSQRCYASTLQIGNMVSRKLLHYWKGPFEVSECVGSSDYRVKMQRRGQVQVLCSSSVLKLFIAGTQVSEEGAETSGYLYGPTSRTAW